MLMYDQHTGRIFDEPFDGPAHFPGWCPDCKILVLVPIMSVNQEFWIEHDCGQILVVSCYMCDDSAHVMPHIAVKTGAEFELENPDPRSHGNVIEVYETLAAGYHYMPTGFKYPHTNRLGLRVEP